MTKNTEILESYLNQAWDKIETYELVDLQEVERVLGSDTFIEIYTIIDDNLETEEKLKVFGTMDKLLNSNKSNYVNYTEGTVFREQNPNSVKEKFQSFIIGTCISEAIDDILYNLKNTGETNLMGLIVELIILSNDIDPENEVIKSNLKTTNYLKENKHNISKMLDNLSTVDESVENGYYLNINFNREEDPSDEEMLEILKLINY